MALERPSTTGEAGRVHQSSKQATIMYEQKNQEGPHTDSNEQEGPASRPQQQLRVNDMPCTLHEELDPCLSSTTSDFIHFIHAMIKSLTDYILMLVGSEGNNEVRMPTIPQKREREAHNNHEHPPIILDVSFSLWMRNLGPEGMDEID